jgi:hypothetical protein
MSQENCSTLKLTKLLILKNYTLKKKKCKYKSKGDSFLTKIRSSSFSDKICRV